MQKSATGSRFRQTRFFRFFSRLNYSFRAKIMGVFRLHSIIRHMPRRFFKTVSSRHRFCYKSPDFRNLPKIKNSPPAADLKRFHSNHTFDFRFEKRFRK